MIQVGLCIISLLISLPVSARTIVTTGAPKSGIHLLTSYIQQIIGIKKHTIVDGDMFLQHKYMEQSNEPFHLLVGTPIYDEHNVTLIEQYKALVIYIIRDPRDQLISSAQAIFKYRNRISAAKNKDLNAIIMDLIFQGSALYSYQYPYDQVYSLHGITDLYNLWLPWADHPQTLVVAFESLSGTQGQQKQLKEIQRIAQFLGTRCSTIQARQIIHKMSGGLFSLFKKKPNVGIYKSVFTKQHKQALNEIAGDLMVRLGYS